MLADIEKDLAELDMTASMATLCRMKETAESFNATISKLNELQLELQGRITDEMGEKFFLSLSSGEAERFENPHWNGAKLFRNLRRQFRILKKQLM
jgi:hypothetical protein